jgi:hypothetical protein
MGLLHHVAVQPSSAKQAKTCSVSKKCVQHEKYPIDHIGYRTLPFLPWFYHQ